MKHKLCVHFKSQLVHELQLCVDTQYTIGRSENADIQLTEDKSISRQHLSLCFENNMWQIKMLSKMGQLIYQGHSVQKIELQKNDNFSLGFYTFYYVQKHDEQAANGEVLPAYDEALGQKPDQHEALPQYETTDKDINDNEAQNHEPQHESPAQYATPDKDINDYEDQNIEPHGHELEHHEVSGDNKNNHINDHNNTANAETYDDSLEAQPTDGEDTYISDQHLAARLSITMPDKYGGQMHLELQLEGQSWLAGRGKKCPIYIKSSKISRQHFEITKHNNQFFVTDLGSSNGTKLNGSPLTPHQQNPLLNGDTIRVKDIRFVFSVQSACQHEDMTRVFAAAAANETTNTYQDLKRQTPQQQNHQRQHLHAQNLQQQHPQGHSPHGQGSHGQYPHEHTLDMHQADNSDPLSSQAAHLMHLKTQKKMQQKKMFFVAAVVLAAAWWLSQTDQKPRELASPKTKAPQTNQQQLKSLYDIAHAHYVEGKYELCLDQIKRITTLEVNYEPATQLKTHCQQALQVHQFNTQRTQQAEKRAQTEQQVKNIVATCQKKKHTFKTTAQLHICLEKAIELDPENPAISELEVFVDNKHQQRKNKKIQNQKQARRYKRAQAAFDRAFVKLEAKQLKKALNAYKKFVSQYADIQALAAKANKHITDIENQINTQTQHHFNECQSAVDNNEHKQAFQLCQKVLKIDRRHKKARALMQQITGVVCKKTKTLFADANFHEYGGNLTAAKEKLQAIINIGIRQCPQYARAKRKLKKYGAGENN